MSATVGAVSPARHVRLVLLTIALAVGIALVGAEILVRVLTRYNTPDTVRASSVQYVPSIFARHRFAPNQNVDVDATWGGVKSGQQATRRVYRINDQGYRGEAFAQPKPPGEVRVVVLGGSSVFDPNATEGEDWPHLVEKRLRELGHRDVVVINAGIPGHASFDSVGRLYSQIWTFSPDFVLLYGAWNDLKDFPELSAGTPLIELVKPYVPDADPLQHYRGTLDHLLAYSQLYVKARNLYLMRTLRVGPEGQARAERSGRTYGPRALAQYRLDVQLVVDASRDVGATPILLTEATLVAPDNDERDRARIHYEYQGMDHATLVNAFRDCNDVVRSVAREKTVPLLDVASMLSGKSDLFADHVHTTHEGSVAIADAVAAFLGPRLAGTPHG